MSWSYVVPGQSTWKVKDVEAPVGSPTSVLFTVITPVTRVLVTSTLPGTVTAPLFETVTV